VRVLNPLTRDVHFDACNLFDRLFSGIVTSKTPLLNRALALSGITGAGKRMVRLYAM